MGANEVDRFDQDWNRVANQLGFKSNNALEYGGGQPYQARDYGRGGDDRRAQARGLGMSGGGGYADSRGLGYVDEGRRGHFIPDY